VTLQGELKRPLPALDKTALLSRHYLFRELGRDLCERLSSRAKMRDVPRRTTIFAKGDPGACLFAVWFLKMRPSSWNW